MMPDMLTPALLTSHVGRSKLGCRVEQPDNVIFLSDIALHRNRAPPKRLDPFDDCWSRRTVRMVGNRDIGARFGQPHGGCRADA